MLPAPMPSAEPQITPEILSALMQDPMIAAAIQRVLAGQAGLPGLPPGSSPPPPGSPGAMEEPDADDAAPAGPPPAKAGPAPDLIAAAKKRTASRGPQKKEASR